MNLQRRFEAVRAMLRDAGRDLAWKFQEPASEEQIADCERAIGCALPDEFQTLLRSTNGFWIKVDGETQEVIVFGAADVAEEHERFERLYRGLVQTDSTVSEEGVNEPAEPFWNGLVAFAHYGIGECLFNTKPRLGEPGLVLDLDFEDLEGTRERAIATSLDDWISKLLACAVEEFRLIYWIERYEGPN